VYRGKRMAGRMGNDRVTVRGLSVVAINPETNILTVKGLVPGAKSLLIIPKAKTGQALSRYQACISVVGGR
jgi:large subunit ribosomal protein L3